MIQIHVGTFTVLVQGERRGGFINPGVDVVIGQAGPAREVWGRYWALTISEAFEGALERLRFAQAGTALAELP